MCASRYSGQAQSGEKYSPPSGYFRLLSYTTELVMKTPFALESNFHYFSNQHGRTPSRKVRQPDCSSFIVRPSCNSFSMSAVRWRSPSINAFQHRRTSSISKRLLSNKSPSFSTLSNISLQPVLAYKKACCGHEVVTRCESPMSLRRRWPKKGLARAESL